MFDNRLTDKNWRIRRLYKIRDKERRLVRFVPNMAQKHFSEHAARRNIILKSRQLGFTTFETIDSLDDTLFNRNFDALLIAQDLDSAESVFDKKIYLAWESFPMKDLYRVDMDQAKTLKVNFSDGTFSSIAVDTSGRSGTFHRVHVTEFAKVAKEHPSKAQEIIEGTIPAVPSNGRVDIESTAEGGQGLFADIFWEAWKRGEPTRPEEFKAHFYNWKWDPDVLKTKPEKNLPKEILDYQHKMRLSSQEAAFYFTKWTSFSRDWEMMFRQYPTTPEEAFQSIIKGVIYAAEIGRARAEGRFNIYPFDRALKVHTVWDLGVGPNLAIGFYQRSAGRVRMIDFWQGEEKEGLPEACREVLRKPYVYGKHFFPHDVKATDESTGKTRRQTAESLLSTKIFLVPEVSFNDGIHAGRMLWDHLFVNIPTCQLWLDGVSEYRWKWNKQLGVFTKDPEHDSASHKGDVHRYAALCERDMTNDQVVQVVKQRSSPKPYVPEFGDYGG